MKLQNFIKNLTKAFQAKIAQKLFPRKYFQNQEQNINYNFYLPYKNNNNGVSAFIRMKNEEQKFYYCLKSIIDVFDEIIVIE